MIVFIKRFCGSLSLLGILLMTLVYGPIDANAAEGPSHCMVKNVNQDDVLNIRIEPDPGSEKVGTIPSDAQSVIKLGPSQVVASDEWFEISYETVTGWVNSKYLHCWNSKVVAERAHDIITALKDRDMEKFSNYVHPDKGVRFSPYAYVEPDQDLTFSADEVKALLSDNSKRQWGYYDGSGDSINMTFQQYFRRFVYTHDFSNTEDIYYNVISKKGNTTDNSREIYPDAVIVEYHVPASDPSKMDWASLRLVLEEYNDDWYVTGLIHDEWTI